MKSRMLLIKIIPLLLILSLLPLGSISCGTEFESLALELLEDWSDAHDVNPTTLAGAANLAKRTASGSTGDEEADAAIGLVRTVKDIQEGDKLMEEGREKRDAAKMDAAIEKRPNDWSYRASRTALAFEQDDFRTANHQSQKAFDMAVNRGNNKAEKIRYCTQTIDELESSTIKPGSMGPGCRYEYYELLQNTYGRRYLLTGNEHDNVMRKHYVDLKLKIER